MKHNLNDFGQEFLDDLRDCLLKTMTLTQTESIICGIKIKELEFFMCGCRIYLQLDETTCNIIDGMDQHPKSWIESGSIFGSKSRGKLTYMILLSLAY